MTTTKIGTYEEPFDIRKCPIWAIPTLRFLMSRPEFDVIEFYVDKETQGTPLACGVVRVNITNNGLYNGLCKGLIYKSDMNAPWKMPRLFLAWVYTDDELKCRHGDDS